jgi:thiol-disulfide isomerase/thioredoxin
VRVVAWIGLLALCLGLVGCRLFGKKDATAPGAADRAALPAPDPARAAAAAGGGGPPAGVDGLLAGRVLDSYGTRPPATVIRVVALEGGKDAAGAPLDVTADDQGFFTIYKLQPGQHYKLVARARDGDHLLAGVTYVTPPDPKVVIRISEDFAGGNVPPLPSEPTWPGAKPQGGKEPKQPPASLERPSRDGQGPANSGQPRGNNGPAGTQPAVVTPAHPDMMVDHDPGAIARNQIRAEVPGPGSHGTAPLVQPPASPASPPAPPYCVIGRDGDFNSVNFVLRDLDGQPWEFRTRPHGRLVLLDFWGTWCPHCLRAVPELAELQARYGSWGLDVIGIAYEQQGTPEEQVRNVRSCRDRLGMNYRILMGGGMASCPLKTQLGVQSFPTLILLDERGHVLGRWEGLSAKNRAEIKSWIPWYLNVR